MNKKMYQAVIISCLSTFALTLGGCGGGGGGSSVVVRPTTLTTYSNGISQDATYTANGTTVTSVTDQGVSETGVSASITTYDDDGTIQKIAITTPGSSVSWDATSGDIIDNSDVVVVATNAAETNIGVVINTENATVPWEYQTFGIWETGLGTGSGSVGAVTVGTPTTGSAIPKTGIATFTGISGGVYVDAAGIDYITASSLTANVDFPNRSIALATTATNKVNTLTGAETTAANLDMTGTLTYLLNTNSFDGNVSATGGMTGTSTGQFYGPAAEELGGVFSLEGASAVESFVGAYGAKQ